MNAALRPKPDEVPDLQTHLARAATAPLSSADAEEVVAAIAEMVAHPEYPCLGARSVFRRDAAHVVVLDSLEQPHTLELLAEELERFGETHEDPEDFVSFVAVFRGPLGLDERAFESTLWQVLQGLHDGDDKDWAPGVSADPRSPHFAFSHAGRAYFIVGLHPGASRIARRAPLPTLVFNLHEQFERLRRSGDFDKMRTAIRRRDQRVQGSINPMAADHGARSEARQYSGRAVEEDWHPPFRPNLAADERPS